MNVPYSMSIHSQYWNVVSERARLLSFFQRNQSNWFRPFRIPFGNSQKPLKSYQSSWLYKKNNNKNCWISTEIRFAASLVNTWESAIQAWCSCVFSLVTHWKIHICRAYFHINTRNLAKLRTQKLHGIGLKRQFLLKLHLIYVPTMKTNVRMSKVTNPSMSQVFWMDFAPTSSTTRKT